MVSSMHRLLLRKGRNNRSNSDFQTFFEEFRDLNSDRINFKTFVFLAVIGPSEHHHTAQTSKFNNCLNGASTMLNNVFKINSSQKCY